MKYFLKVISIFFIFFITNAYSSTTSDKLYEKIDLFGEVLEKIKEEYVDEIDQADVMDSEVRLLKSKSDQLLNKYKLLIDIGKYNF